MDKRDILGPKREEKHEMRSQKCELRSPKRGEKINVK
jgi:hypothetical protein